MVFNENQKQQIESLLHGLSENQIVWLAGYLTGVSQSAEFTKHQKSDPENLKNNTPSINTSHKSLTVLYGSRTGNGEFVAKKLKSQAESRGFQVTIHDMGDYPLHKLSGEQNLLVIVSTHGEGVPPVPAEDFYDYIHGKRVKPLENTNFSVLALGDKSYVHFCKTGKDVDKKLEELGGKRIYNRVDCDVDFHSSSDEWITGVLTVLGAGDSETLNSEVNGKSSQTHGTSAPSTIFNRQNPFKARILEKLKLSGRGSTKEIFHYELSLDKSGITYEPGDAVGIYAANPVRLVQEVIEAFKFNPDEKVIIDNTEIALREALTNRYELSNLNRDILEEYNKFAHSKHLTEIINDEKSLAAFVYNNDLVDLASLYPTGLNSNNLISILRKVHPRLYSISSSMLANPQEVHLTVAAVRYNNSRYKEGICSTFLSDRISDDEEIFIYPERNPDFRLPEDNDVPVIMVGPGTGIAPFRAFLQEREAQEAKGKNWLFFGDRNFTTDFLYQTELQSWHKNGLLNRLNVAFSRDTNQKVYVQNRMLEHGKELVKWLDEGAHFYICGDAKNMALDVNRTLINILVKEKKYDSIKAEEYIKSLKKTKRYQTDVY